MTCKSHGGDGSECELVDLCGGIECIDRWNDYPFALCQHGIRKCFGCSRQWKIDDELYGCQPSVCLRYVLGLRYYENAFGLGGDWGAWCRWNEWFEQSVGCV